MAAFELFGMGKYLEPAAYALLFLPVLGMAWADIAVMAGFTVGVLVGVLGLAKYFKFVK
jgi:hypothetical protein